MSAAIEMPRLAYHMDPSCEWQDPMACREPHAKMVSPFHHSVEGFHGCHGLAQVHHPHHLHHHHHHQHQPHYYAIPHQLPAHDHGPVMVRSSPVDPDMHLSSSQEELLRLISEAEKEEREKALLLQRLETLSLSGPRSPARAASPSVQAHDHIDQHHRPRAPVLVRDEGGLFRLVSPDRSATPSPSSPRGARTALAPQCLFPAREETDDLESDHFRMFRFKVQPCTESRCHDWAQCPFAHPGEKASRRDPRVFRYSAVPCPDVKRSGKCARGDACPMAHGVFECWLHPARYRTQPCKDGARCPRKVCFFAHSSEQLRLAPAAAAAAAADAAASASSDGGIHPSVLMPTRSSQLQSAVSPGRVPSPTSVLSPLSSSPPASPPTKVLTPFSLREAHVDVHWASASEAVGHPAGGTPFAAPQIVQYPDGGMVCSQPMIGPCLSRQFSDPESMPQRMVPDQHLISQQSMPPMWVHEPLPAFAPVVYQAVQEEPDLSWVSDLVAE